MYLSRLFINPGNSQALREIESPYELHRTLLSAFPNGKVHLERKDEDAIGLLFRLEEKNLGGFISILVQSKIAPDWRPFKGKSDGNCRPYLLAPDLIPNGGQNPACKEFNLKGKLASGQVFSFRLKANPTVKKDRPGMKQGRRVALVAEEDQLQWLQRKAEVGGFRLLQVQSRKNGRLRDETRKMVWFAVQFDGIMQATDPDKLLETVSNGIGPAKSFGFGLLSLSPVR